jgi:RNA polymerase sigma factor (TIGR02999 family)
MVEHGQAISELLQRWRSGDQAALDLLAPLVYNELLKIARSHLRRQRRNHTLQSAALVNEAYIRLQRRGNFEWNDRKHFFAVAAQIMRHVLVDYARGQDRKKRGGSAANVDIDEACIVSPERLEEVLDIDDALRRLADLDRRKMQVVELRFFAGLDVEETAEVLGVAPNTVIRDWRFARAWLKTHLVKASP